MSSYSSSPRYVLYLDYSALVCARSIPAGDGSFSYAWDTPNGQSVEFLPLYASCDMEAVAEADEVRAALGSKVYLVDLYKRVPGTTKKAIWGGRVCKFASVARNRGESWTVYEAERLTWDLKWNCITSITSD